MKGLLVRVGVDSTSGFWNAPVDPGTNRFVYVPVPEIQASVIPELGRSYGEVVGALQGMDVQLPQWLAGQYMHLDPDFAESTYGDGWPRSAPILDLRRGDFLVFWAGLAPICRARKALVDAIIGFYFIDEIVPVERIPQDRWHENAHTRRTGAVREIVVRAQPGVSGRLTQCIPVGEYREGAHRITRDLRSAWGDISSSNGYIQRSGRLPYFKNAERFLSWFRRQQPELVRENN
jgi:hypothetical protein